jgi:cell division transport system permease protein
MTALVEASPRRVLPEGRFAGPMPWVIAIMMFLSVLAAAGGLAIARTVASMEGALAGRLTVQIIEANPDVRARQRAVVVAELRRQSNVSEVTEVGDAEVRDLLTPWLGPQGLDRDIPVPALVDVSLRDATPAAIDEVERAVRQIARSARVDRHADWLGPLGGLLDTMQWLALAMVFLTAVATAAAVILGVRAALDQHRATIDVMHLMGATDRQISRLFERRVAQDAISGAALGFVVALSALLLVGWRIAAVGAALVTGSTLGWIDWLLIALLPLGAVGLTVAAARFTVLRSLARIL